MAKYAAQSSLVSFRGVSVPITPIRNSPNFLRPAPHAGMRHRAVSAGPLFGSPNLQRQETQAQRLSFPGLPSVRTANLTPYPNPNPNPNPDPTGCGRARIKRPILQLYGNRQGRPRGRHPSRVSIAQFYSPSEAPITLQPPHAENKI